MITNRPTPVRHRRYIGAATLVAIALVTLAATPAGAHVPPPVWTTPDALVELPDVPVAIPAVSVAAAGDTMLWTVSGAGVVTAHGDAELFGDLSDQELNTPVVGITAAAEGTGYWLASASGDVWAFGSAVDFGSVGHLTLDAPVVGIASSSTSEGYWLAASDGGVFAFGDAAYMGSAAPFHPVEPIVAIAPLPDDLGYWLGARDGGVFSFGGAGFHGSMGGVRLDGDVVGMAASPDGSGYWLAGADGGIFTFGTAVFAASGAGQIVGAASAIVSLGQGDYALAIDSGDPAPLPSTEPDVVLPDPEAVTEAQTYYDSLSAAQIAIWDAMADCESNERWDVNTGNGYYGGLQFSLGSWQWVGGTGYPHEASRIEQIFRGSKLQAIQGWGAWPGCASRLGLI